MLPNLLINGDFSRGLYQWQGSGAIARSLGYPRANCAQLSAGQDLAYPLGIAEQYLYTLHYFYRLASGATLTIGYGAATQAHAGTPEDVWREGMLSFSLEVGEGNDSVTMISEGGVAYVDTVTLMSGGLPTTRSAIATTVAARIASLASDKGLSTTPSAVGPEGDYSAAIDEALRAVGAMNTWGDVDVTLLGPGQVSAVTETTRASMLQLLRSSYALETDVSLGPRSESRSQIAGSIDEMLAGTGSDRRPSQARMGHGEWRK